MLIGELQAKQGKVELKAEIIEKGDIREFEKFGKKGRVCNTKIKDDSGSISLTLWNEDIDRVNVGDKIEIRNGYVSEWQGEKQLSTGKFGSMKVIEDEENNTIEKDIEKLQEKSPSMESIDELEEKINPTEKKEEEDDIDKEMKEFEKIEKKASNTFVDEEKLENELKPNAEEVMTLDELEEIKTLSPEKEREESPQEDEVTEDEKKEEDDYFDDLVEEEIVKENK